MTRFIDVEFHVRRAEIAPVIESVQNDGPEVRVELLRALARLPLDAEGFRLVGRAVVRELDRVSTMRASEIRGLIEAAVTVPVKPLRERIRHAAIGPVSVLRPAARAALARALDPSMVAERLDVPGDAMDEWSCTVRAVTPQHRALLRLAHDEVSPDLHFDPEEFSRKFWLAVGLARLAEAEPLAGVLDAIDDGAVLLLPLTEEPARSAAALRGLGPWSESIARDLRHRARKHADPAAADASRGVEPTYDDPGDADTTGLLTRALLLPAPVPLAPSRRTAAERSTDDEWLALEVARLLDEAPAAAPLDMVRGNDLVMKAIDCDACLDPEEPAVLRSYELAMARDDGFAEQAAWLVARGGVVHFAPRLLRRIMTEASAEKRLVVARLLSDAGLQRFRSQAPVFDGVPAGMEVLPTCREFIDDQDSGISMR